MARRTTISKVEKTPVVAETVLSVPLTKVHANYDWNARSGDWKTPSGIDDESEFLDLVESIDERGQTTAVIVRARKDGKYDLVSGFRRHAAITLIGKRDKIEPTIKIIVRDLTEGQAAEENASENIARQNLKRPADVAFAVARVKELQTRERRFKSDTALAFGLGMKQAYCQKLLQIHKDLLPELFRHWREASNPLPVSKVLEIAKLPQEKQFDAYKKLTEARPEQREGGPGRGGNVTERAAKAAEKLGELLGTIEARGLAEFTEPLYTVESMGQMLPQFTADKDGNPQLSEEEWESVAAAAEARHNATYKLVTKAPKAAE